MSSTGSNRLLNPPLLLEECWVWENNHTDATVEFSHINELE